MSDDVVCSVVNPYALVDAIADNPVSWDRVSDPGAYLEAVLGQPPAKLFDPKLSSILYPSVQLLADGKVRMLNAVESRQRITQLVFDASARARGLSTLTSRLAVPAQMLLARLRATDDAVRVALLRGAFVESATGTPWNPAGLEWFDKGDYFEEGTEYRDPVQGALGDCYFIAALSAVAWAWPETIVHRNRTTGTNQQDFVDMVDFYASGAAKRVQASEKVPVKTGTHNWVYARSMENSEIWPAVYEKLFAKWRTNNTTDQPDYGPIAGGDPVGSCHALTNKAKFYNSTSGNTADQLWTKITERCASNTGAALVPLVAWTYSSGESSPDHVVYNEVNLVANHAYTVLGRMTTGSGTNLKRYVILRNPWGTHGALGGTAATSGAWNAITLGIEGVFGLQVETFKRYYAGFGGVA
ncbi:MAG: C2 family cysteine protease [Polyangiales bacterium]